MKSLITLILVLVLGVNLYAQTDKVKELVAQGTEFHDGGEYDQAIACYKAALKIDKNSTLANYELSYTYMVTQNYKEGIKYSEKVIKQNTSNQHGAYIVLGSCLDMLGKPEKAVATFREGLTKFPNSNLLNYNLALTLYNQHDYEAAEEAVINAIIAKPSHGSSHILLSAIMKAKGQRVRALLSNYYFLMLEPNSKRASINYTSLQNLLSRGIMKKDSKNITVKVPVSSTDDSTFNAAEIMISLLGASRYTKDNNKKSDPELFAETTHKFFAILSELKKDNSDFWWNFYVTKFYDLVQTKNDEAFSYYISQSTNSELVNKWIANHPDKMERLKVWLSKN